MPNVLSTKAAGDIVTLKVSGTPRNFIVVQQGRPASGNYDTGFDNVTWLLMQDIYDQRQWGGSANAYANSSIHRWLNNESSGFLSLLDADIRAVIPTVKIPYRPGSGTSSNVSSGANGLACKAFLLSMLEVGLSPDYSPSEGATLAYFTSGGNARRIANYNGSPSSWWTRSPSTYSSNFACRVRIDGTAADDGVDDSGSGRGCRPALPLPSNLYVSDDGSILTNEPPTAPGSINVTNTIAGGQATITLTAATDPDGIIASYRYERSVDRGQWQQFADVNSLTQTDQIGEDWGTVAYRACAVDNDGAAGPYVTSETKTINDGYLMIGGPVSSMGVKSIPFDFEATVGVSGQTSVTSIEATMWLDHEQVYHESVNQGATLEYHVDTRVMSSGQHTIQVTLEKEEYLPANASYYFTVPSHGLPDGGMSVQLEDDQGNPLYPRTTTRDVIGPSGKTVQNEIEDLQKAHLGTTGHLEHIDTVLGPASNVVWPREANTTYASRCYYASRGNDVQNTSFPSSMSGATSNSDVALNFGDSTITLISLTANTIFELLKYVLNTHVATPPDLTVNFTPLDQPKILTAATNTGTTATDLQNALQQIMDAYPTQNLYMIEDATTSSTVYYVACVDTIDADTTSKTCAYVVSTDPTKWYQSVQLTFVDSSNPAKRFTQLSGNYTSQITTPGTGSDKGSQNAALIALLQTNKGYYYTFTDYAGTTYYMASTAAISMSGDSVTANCDYVKNAETTVYTGGTISFNSVPDAPNWNVGQVVTFAGLQWIVSHKTSSECYLTAQTLQDSPSWNNLQTTCQNFANTQLTENQKAFLKQIGAGNTSGYVFVATYDQMNGGFSYFNSNSRRSAGDVYWTSTELTSSAAWSVNAAGVLGPTAQSYSLRFRPSICFDLTKL